MPQIIRIARGKETVVDEGSRSKINDRLKQLRKSTERGRVCGRGKKYAVKYRLEE